MNKKQHIGRLTALLKHSQNELARHQALREHYEATLARTQQSQWINYQSNLSQAQSQTIRKNKSALSSSELQHQDKTTRRGTSKGQAVTFQAEYMASVDNLGRILGQLGQKQSTAIHKKSLRKSAKWMKTSKVVPSKGTTLSAQKTSEPGLSLSEQRTKLLVDLGDLSLLGDDDQIVNNLIKNIQHEEQIHIQLVVAKTQVAVQQKMVNYLVHQTQKQETILFRLEREQIEKSLSSLKSNKQTVSCGYTERMKELVDKGLK